MGVYDAISELNNVAKKTYVPDLTMLFAACPAFGSAETILIVSGAKHELAAAVMADHFNGTAVVEFSPEVEWPDGSTTPAKTYTVVTW
jgi:hypothetical protein